jgi:hypothetical protein
MMRNINDDDQHPSSPVSMPRQVVPNAKPMLYISPTATLLPERRVSLLC